MSSLLKRQNLIAHDLAEEQSLSAENTGLWLADLDLDAGFHDVRAQLSFIAAADIWGSRLHENHTDIAVILAPIDMRVDDVLVHEDHGVGILRDLTRVTTDVGD